MKCRGHRTDGEPCGNDAIKGGTVCHKHGGSAKQVRRMATVRHELARWAPDQTADDPGELLLRLMTQARMRADQHADELARILTEQGWVDAFVGDAYGEFGKIGEYARQLAQWEFDERRFAADLAIKAVAAGIAERQVRVAEQQVDLFARTLDEALAAAGLTARAAEVKGHVARRLRLAAS